MVKLTVMYNLPPEADHEVFIKWRTTEHQKENMEIPGVIKSDFYIVREAWQENDVPYRYMTEVYWPDMEAFKEAFFNLDYQTKLSESLKKISNPMFLISKEVLSDSTGE